MEATQPKHGVLQKVGESLYRYSSNRVYYARIKRDGKEIKRSLGTTDPALARRNLAALKDELRQIDRSQGWITLEKLADRYLATIQHQKPKTIERKTFIVGRIKDHWPTGKLTQVGKIRPSDVDLWLSRYHFGSASRNLFISSVKEIFALALRDRIIAASPAAHLRYAKREKPIRPTPSYEQFKAIIADVRAQPFNADAQDSADFLEFLGLAGLGQAEASSHLQLRILISMRVDSSRSATRQAQALQFQFFRKLGHSWKGCVKTKPMVILCSTFGTPKKRLPVHVAAWGYRYSVNARFGGCSLPAQLKKV